MLVYAAAFIFGSILGSFLNVCIWRMPRNESIVKPASHCPDCNRRLKWYDNIPFISYILLKGRCRNCKKKISFRYFLVELVTAGLCVAAVYRFGVTPLALIHILLFSGLIISSFIDIPHRVIPDSISIGGMVAGLMLSFLYPALHSLDSRLPALWQSALGLFIGGGAIYLTGMLGDFIFKKESMGGGDVKLLAMVGAFIGWKLVLVAFFLAPIFGALVGVVIKIKYKESLIPYGPFLSLGTIISIFYGQRIIGYLFAYY